MSSVPPVRYADNNGVQIAYQVFGDGPIDVLTVYEWGSNIDMLWEHPMAQVFLRHVAEFARVIHLDLRGAGLSDRVDSLPPLEEWAEDVRVVMDAVGSTRAAVVGHGHAAQLCMLFAAMHPELTSSLVVMNGFARLSRAADYPWGMPANVQERVLATMRERWGNGESLAALNPDVDAASGGRDFLARMERAACSPAKAVIKQGLIFEVDVRDVLSSIRVPTLVIDTPNVWVPDGHAHYLVGHIAGAKQVTLPANGYSPTWSVDERSVAEVVEEFLTGERSSPRTDRSLATVVFTDIVGSTESATELGDRRWRSLLELHESIAEREVARAEGRLVKFTGDGMLATFDGPARAVRCLQSLGETLEPLGLPIRGGVHTGEVELIGDDIGGIAVHVAARIMALAGAGEVYTSSTVRDLTVGSGLIFKDRGEHALKGVTEPLRVFQALT